MMDSKDKKPKPKKVTRDQLLLNVAENITARSYVKKRQTDLDDANRQPRFGGILTLKDSREFLIYNKDKGIWEFNRQTDLEVEIAKYLSNINISGMRQVLNKIKELTFYNRDDLYEYSDFICLRNNVTFSLKDWKGRPYNPKFKMTRQIPVNFVNEAKCPNFDKFLSEVLDEENIQLIWEYIGYCLYYDYSIRKSLFIYGSGANGKSLFLDVLTQFLGYDNCSNINIAQMTGFQSDYYIARLFGKVANICTDLSNEDIHRTGVFKQLVGGNDKITGRHITKTPFSFYNVAKLIFSANELPKPDNDEGEAFMNRMMTVEFPRKFKDSGKKGKELMDGMTTDQEMSGILNKALISLKRLLERGYFNMSEKQGKYAMLSDPIQSFIDSKCIMDEDLYCNKQIFYEQYIAYCEHNRLKTEKLNILGKIMKGKGFVSSRKKYGEYGDRVRIYLGMGLQTGDVDYGEMLDFEFDDIEGGDII